MIIVILCNAFAAAAGLALFALAIWVAVDGYKLYPISGVSGKDDIFAGAWIAIFTGFAYFCTCIFGIYAARKQRRSLMLAYLIIMFIIFIFECASCITAATNRDYVSRLLLLLSCLQVECCGTDSPLDWVEYNSTFRQLYGTTYPWPLNCCKRLSSFEVADSQGCIIGQTSTMFTQGCFTHIESVLSRYTWAVSWYGFSVQMFVFFMLLIAMVYFTQLG
uniref:Uroplakin 1a n=1 Tax=Astyanax mexicanus TaxID=7994 RepID=A0A8B9JBQ6_ASTMX